MASSPTNDGSGPDGLDATDLAILAELQRDGRISNKDLAARVHLTPSPCRERVRRLEERGVIQGYHALLDPTRLGQGLLLFVEIRLANPESDQALLDLVADTPEVLECHMVAGAFDFLLKLRVQAMNAYRNGISAQLQHLPGLLESRTIVVLDEVKMTTDLPLQS